MATVIRSHEFLLKGMATWRQLLSRKLTPLSTGFSQKAKGGLGAPGFLDSYKNAGVMSMFQVAANTDQWIEFTGGPFDGHWQPHHSALNRLPSDVVWLVTEDAFRQLDRPRWMKSSSGGDLTSAALYELDVSSGLPNYRYAGSIGPRSFSDAIRNLN